MKPVIDMHTHTLICGHGYSTLKENIEAAQAKGLRVLGLSEHGPAMLGAPNVRFFTNYKCIPRQYGDLKLFCGAEANILDYDGHLDLEESVLERLDYVIASMHLDCVPSGSVEENTRASIMAMKNPCVTILGHPDDDRYPLDREAVVKAAGEEGVAIEINNSSLNPLSVRKGGRENNLELLHWCAHFKVPVLMGTDSHICYTVGDFEDTLKLIEEAAFPEELILNYDESNLQRLLNPKKKR